MAAFRIYYDDGATYTRDPFLAPRTGVQVIAYDAPTPTGFALQHGKDYYCWDVPRALWRGTDGPGMIEYLVSEPGPKTVLFGRSMRDADYWRVVARATREGLG